MHNTFGSQTIFQELRAIRTPIRWALMPSLIATTLRLVKACHMTHGARIQCCTLKWPANCWGGQIGFLLLWIHIHATPAAQHCPLRCLLCLLHLLLSRVTTLTFILVWIFRHVGDSAQLIMISTEEMKNNLMLYRLEIISGLGTFY